MVGGPKRIVLDGQFVRRAPSGAATHRIAVLLDLLDLGDQAPGGVVRHAVAVEVTGIAGTGVVGRVPAEGTKIAVGVLLALRAGGERDREVIGDVLDESGAAAKAPGSVVRQIPAL